MGYSMPEDKEIYSLSEIIREFDPKRIGVAGAFFDIQKLGWMNQKRLIETIPDSKLWEKLKEWMFNDDFMQKLMPLVHPRIKTFGDFLKVCDFFFINDLGLTLESLCPKGTSGETIAYVLQAIIWSLDAAEDWSGQALEKASHEIAEVFGLHHKKVIMPLLFMTIMGKSHGPSLFESVTLLGKDRTRVRFMQAIELLGGISSKKMDMLKKGWAKKNCKELIV
jgi:glutamyl-tRNA synthetase